jgi:hypothetical protein
LDDRNHVVIEIIGPQCSAGIVPAVQVSPGREPF